MDILSLIICQLIHHDEAGDWRSSQSKPGHCWRASVPSAIRANNASKWLSRPEVYRSGVKPGNLPMPPIVCRPGNIIGIDCIGCHWPCYGLVRRGLNNLVTEMTSISIIICEASVTCLSATVGANSMFSALARYWLVTARNWGKRKRKRCGCNLIKITVPNQTTQKQIEDYGRGKYAF